MSRNRAFNNWWTLRSTEETRRAGSMSLSDVSRVVEDDTVIGTPSSKSPLVRKECITTVPSGFFDARLEAPVLFPRPSLIDLKLMC